MKHGGDLSEAIKRHGGTAADWLDLSTGINPWPWPVPADLPPATWHRLPSSCEHDALIAAARTTYAVPDGASLVAAPGTQALIQWLPRIAPPGPVAIVATTYDEHARAWAAAGHDVVDIDDLAALPSTVRHAVVVNPNNPDGRVTDRMTLARAADATAARGGWLVVDESFADIVPEASCVELCAAAPAVVLRSFGKFFGLAGLRLGFVITQPAIAACIAAALGPWPVSGPAIAIGRAALADDRWQAAMRLSLASEALDLDAILTKAGLTVVGGTSLFRLARHPQARGLHERLARRRIWTRIFERHADLLRFGLPADRIGLDRLGTALTDRHG